MATLKLSIPRDVASSLREFFGEVSPDSVIAAVDYACRRKLALSKDAKRHDKGKLPTRFYRPRLDNVAKVPKPLAQAVATIERVAERLTKNGAKP